MERKISESHPLRTYFRESVHHAVHDRIGLTECDDVEEYVVDLLVEFLHDERIFAIRDSRGRRVETVAEMLAEADVRLNADSFQREREVHRHIGDFLLFCSGLFPEMLRSLRGFPLGSPEKEAARQGSFSYAVVSSFDHAPYAVEAPTFRRLSDEFAAVQEALLLLRASFQGLRRQPGWGGS